MNETAVIEDIQRKFDLLPIDAQQKVLSLLESRVEEALKGVSGKDLLRFAGTIPKEDLDLMEKAIEEECERIEPSEW